MTELTNQQIAEIYNDIKYHSEGAIKDIIDEELSYSSYVYEDYSVLFPNSEDIPELPKSILLICNEILTENNDSIIEIIRTNSNKSETILSIIEMVTPIIAYTYDDIPVKAIIATLTILCKKIINNHITGQNLFQESQGKTVEKIIKCPNCGSIKVRPKELKPSNISDTINKISDTMCISGFSVLRNLYSGLLEFQSDSDLYNEYECLVCGNSFSIDITND